MRSGQKALWKVKTWVGLVPTKHSLHFCACRRTQASGPGDPSAERKFLRPGRGEGATVLPGPTGLSRELDRPLRIS